MVKAKKSEPYATTYGWVLRNTKRLAEPVPYAHPSGAVICVRLQGSELKAIAKERGASG